VQGQSGIDLAGLGLRRDLRFLHRDAAFTAQAVQPQHDVRKRHIIKLYPDVFSCYRQRLRRQAPGLQGNAQALLAHGRHLQRRLARQIARFQRQRLQLGRILAQLGQFFLQGDAATPGRVEKDRIHQRQAGDDAACRQQLAFLRRALSPEDLQRLLATGQGHPPLVDYGIHVFAPVARVIFHTPGSVSFKDSLRAARPSRTCAWALASTISGFSLTIRLRSRYSSDATTPRPARPPSASPKAALRLVKSSMLACPLCSLAAAILRCICSASMPYTGASFGYAALKVCCIEVRTVAASRFRRDHSIFRPTRLTITASATRRNGQRQCCQSRAAPPLAPSAGTRSRPAACAPAIQCAQWSASTVTPAMPAASAWYCATSPDATYTVRGASPANARVVVKACCGWAGRIRPRPSCGAWRKASSRPCPPACKAAVTPPACKGRQSCDGSTATLRAPCASKAFTSTSIQARCTTATVRKPAASLLPAASTQSCASPRICSSTRPGKAARKRAPASGGVFRRSKVTSAAASNSTTCFAPAISCPRLPNGALPCCSKAPPSPASTKGQAAALSVDALAGCRIYKVVKGTRFQVLIFPQPDQAGSALRIRLAPHQCLRIERRAIQAHPDHGEEIVAFYIDTHAVNLAGMGIIREIACIDKLFARIAQGHGAGLGNRQRRHGRQHFGRGSIHIHGRDGRQHDDEVAQLLDHSRRVAGHGQ